MPEDDDMIVCEVVSCEACGRETLGILGSDEPAICQDCVAAPDKIHVTGPVDSTDRMHVLDMTCWCLPILDDRLTRLETKVDAIDTRLMRVEAKVDALDAKVDALDAKVDNLDGKFDIMHALVQEMYDRGQS